MLREIGQSETWTDINQNREMIQILVNLMSEPLYEKNQDGYFVLCNQAFLDFFGLPEDVVLGVEANAFFLNQIKRRNPEFELAMELK